MYNHTELNIILLLSILMHKICQDSKKCTSKVDTSKSIKKVSLNYDKSKYDNGDYQGLLKDIKKKYSKDIKNYQINDSINIFIKYYKDKSDENFNKVYETINTLKKDHAYVMKNNIKQSNIKDIISILTKIAKTVGADTFELTIPQMQKLKSSNPKNMKRYSDMFKALLNALSTTVKSELSKAKIDYISLTDINKVIEKIGFPKIYGSDSDKVFIDMGFNVFNSEGDIMSCKMSPYRMRIQVNDKYNAKKDNGYLLKFQAIGAKTWQWCFSKDYKKRKKGKIYLEVNKLLKNIDTYQAKWQKDIHSKDVKISQCALACEIIYITAMRVGTKGNETGGEKTYGLLTLQGKHIKCDGSKVTLAYEGKKAQSQKHVISNKDIAKELCPMVKGKNDQAFEINGDALNDYIRNKLGMKITIHKFRTLRGTAIAYNKLIKDKPCNKLKTDKAKLDYLKKVMTEVGELLGHFNNGKVTYTTALKNYVDPNIIVRYFDECKLKVPKQIQQMVESDDAGANAFITEWMDEPYAQEALKKLTYWTRDFV